MIFEGLCGFPITPISDGCVDINILCKIRDHLDQAGLDSIGVLGSTGSFAYLSKGERTRVLECWSQVNTPWIAGVSATTTKEAIQYCEIAQQNGAKGVIANAVAYVPLSFEELKAYFMAIADNSPLPLCIYDNPVTTGQKLSDDLLQELSAHPNIEATKVFAKPNNDEQHKMLNSLNWRAGYAVDQFCCEAMINGASAWYSTLAGTIPELIVPIMEAIKAGNHDKARELNQSIQALYQLMKQHSGYRLMHALANQRGWTCEIPLPLLMPEVGSLAHLLPD